MTTETAQVLTTTRERHCAHTWLEGASVCMACGAALTFEADTDGLTDDLIDTLEQRLGEVAYDGLRSIIDRVPEAKRRAHLTEARRQVLRELGLGVVNPPGGGES